MGKDFDIAVNGHVMKTVGPQRANLDLTIFRLYINDLLKSVIRSFVNMYTDVVTLYEYTFNILNVQRLVASLLVGGSDWIHSMSHKSN